MNKQKGFTIIELIVVIAIIAVLAAIVLVNVTQYITKGRDSAIKGNLSTLSTDAAVVYDATSSYNSAAANSACASAAANLIYNTINGYGINMATAGYYSCQNSATGFCACAVMASNVNNAFCADSAGRKLTLTNATGPYNCAATCNATNYACQ